MTFSYDFFDAGTVDRKLPMTERSSFLGDGSGSRGAVFHTSLGDVASRGLEERRRTTSLVVVAPLPEEGRTEVGFRLRVSCCRTNTILRS
ncbi:hypothetical protein MRB53_010233 [Persea americana]|uniref:Uncharacterized protein n=1 Tax=Persea americana TaxID=3435 RepID=A0ACC2LR61_PERAE|nr:hypothetical protein MRB53_010233 [Persea americana]